MYSWSYFMNSLCMNKTLEQPAFGWYASQPSIYKRQLKMQLTGNSIAHSSFMSSKHQSASRMIWLNFSAQTNIREPRRSDWTYLKLSCWVIIQLAWLKFHIPHMLTMLCVKVASNYTIDDAVSYNHNHDTKQGEAIP